MLSARDTRKPSRCLSVSLLFAGMSMAMGPAASATQRHAKWPAYRFVPGERQVYRLDYTSAAAADLRFLLQGRSASGQKQSATASNLVYALDTSVRADLETTVLDKKAGVVLVRYRLRHPAVRLNANGQNSAAQTAALQAELGREIYAALDPQ